MPEPEYVVVYAARYPSVDAARAVLDTIGQHKHELTRAFDAAVVDKENGQPHVVRRLEHEHPHIIPERFSHSLLTRKELTDAAEELTADQAGLIVVGWATIEPVLDPIFSGTKVVKEEIEATVEQITSELQAAFKA
jgi:hypothetical protein